MLMTPINVLVIFDSCSGATEKLALAAAVGAVQARASIRMRRLLDNSSDSGDPAVRMRREYVPPTPADTAWADAVIIGAHRKICTGVDNPPDATAFGRRITQETRAIKEA
jgi:hypothetical protein